ncbi:hypothetical protein ACFLRS_01530, partial [Campylobacterota bacterium]
MMTRAWLILADILVHLLLFLSLILFYTSSPLEQNISKEDQMVSEESMTKENLIDTNLEERHVLLLSKVGDPVFIRIFKEESLLEVWIRSGAEYQHLKDYFICAYSGYLGPKLQEGDRQSPEGFYKVKKY